MYRPMQDLSIALMGPDVDSSTRMEERRAGSHTGESHEPSSPAQTAVFAVVCRPPAQSTEGRHIVPVVQWAPGGLVYRLMHSLWHLNIPMIMTGLVCYFVANYTPGLSHTSHAVCHSVVCVVSIVELSVVMGYMDRTLGWAVLHHFDFWVVAAAVCIQGSINAVYFNSTSGWLLVTNLASKVCLAPAICVFVMLRDAAPGIPVTLRTLLILAIWLVYSVHLVLAVFGEVEQSTAEICIHVVRERCQRAEDIRRTADAQIFLFLSRFVWLSLRDRDRCLILKGNVYVVAAVEPNE